MVTMHTSTFVILIIFLIVSSVCNIIQFISHCSTVTALYNLYNSSDTDNETVLDARDAYDQSVKNQLELVKKRLISRINEAIKDGRSCVIISDSTIYPVCEMPQEVLDYLSKEKHYSIEKLERDGWTTEDDFEWKISWKQDK